MTMLFKIIWAKLTFERKAFLVVFVTELLGIMGRAPNSSDLVQGFNFEKSWKFLVAISCHSETKGQMTEYSLWTRIIHQVNLYFIGHIFLFKISFRFWFGKIEIYVCFEFYACSWMANIYCVLKPFKITDKLSAILKTP